MRTFKVTCEFYVRVSDEGGGYRTVEKYLEEEAGEFAEKHLIVTRIRDILPSIN